MNIDRNRSISNPRQAYVQVNNQQYFIRGLRTIATVTTSLNLTPRPFNIRISIINYLVLLFGSS